MRAVHNTPIPDEKDFPVPDDCRCDGGELCEPCQQVIQADEEARLEELAHLPWERF